MAEDFNETRNPADAAMADLKGQIRARIAERQLWPKTIAADLSKSVETIYSVMYRDNIRHTWTTIFDLCQYLGIRIGLIDGLKTPKQRKELQSLSAKELRVVKELLSEAAPKKRRRTK